jgi:hypothetical protein
VFFRLGDFWRWYSTVLCITTTAADQTKHRKCWSVGLHKDSLKPTSSEWSPCINCTVLYQELYVGFPGKRVLIGLVKNTSVYETDGFLFCLYCVQSQADLLSHHKRKKLLYRTRPCTLTNIAKSLSRLPKNSAGLRRKHFAMFMVKKYWKYV